MFQNTYNQMMKLIKGNEKPTLITLPKSNPASPRAAGPAKDWTNSYLDELKSHDSLTLPILRNFYPKLIAKELVNVMPIDKPDVVKGFLKPQFTSTGTWSNNTTFKIHGKEIRNRTYGPYNNTKYNPIPKATKKIEFNWSLTI